MFNLAKATIVPLCIALKLLRFVGCWFVGKLTKRKMRYYKLGYWSNIDSEERLVAIVLY
jgi:hypothetical protein